MNKMKQVTKIIFPVLLMATMSLRAQVQPVQPGQPNELDKQYAPGGTSAFSSTGDNGPSASSSPNKSSEPDFKNVVKNNIGLWPRSIAAFGYERFLTEDISAEGWLGTAYKRDGIFAFIGSDISSTSSNVTQQNIVSLKNIYKYGKSNGIALYLGASVKFHFTGWNYYWGDNTSYLELGMRTYGNKLDISSLGSVNNGSGVTTEFSGDTDVNVRQVNYLVNYGYRFTTDGKVKTSHELYMGIGLRNVSYDAYEQQEIYNSWLGNYEYKYIKTGVRLSSSMPLFVMGYILGFGF